MTERLIIAYCYAIICGGLLLAIVAGVSAICHIQWP